MMDAEPETKGMLMISDAEIYPACLTKLIDDVSMNVICVEDAAGFGSLFNES